MAQRADYLRRIERALALIERSAGEDKWPGVAELAKEAAMSEFHFHRIFRLLTGETPQQTVARVRLGGSLPALASEAGIAGGTASSAYATTQSYARAMKALTGATPSQLRSDPERFAAAVAGLRRPATGTPPFEIEIVDLAPLRLVARRNIGSYDDLHSGYARLFELLMEQIAPEQVTGLYGIPHDDPRFCAPEHCRFDCAVSTDAQFVPQGELKPVEIPGGPSLRLRVPGNYDQVHAALDRLYELAIALDLPLAEPAPLNHYHQDPDDVPEEDLVADLYLALA